MICTLYTKVFQHNGNQEHDHSTVFLEWHGREVWFSPNKSYRRIKNRNLHLPSLTLSRLLDNTLIT